MVSRKVIHFVVNETTPMVSCLRDGAISGEKIGFEASSPFTNPQTDVPNPLLTADGSSC